MKHRGTMPGQHAEPRRVGLFGPYVSRNLGDTATQMAVIQNLQRRCKAIVILGISPEPDNTLQSLGIPAFPLSGLGPTAGNLMPYVDLPSAAQSEAWRRPYSPIVIRRIARFVRTLDLLIISGGGQLDDFWGGAWNHPWSMLIWTALARRYRIPVIYLAVGVDGLKENLSRRFSIMALRIAQRRLFRDSRSYEVMRAMGLEQPCEVCPDLVFALDSGWKGGGTPADSRFVVISPISRKTWSRNETDLHTGYLSALADIGRDLLGRGYAVRIVCSQSAMDMGDAVALATELRQGGASNVEVRDAPRVDDFITAVHGADLVIASRLHGVILSLVTGCPVVALAHLDKVRAVMDDFELGEYCQPLQEVQGDAVLPLVRRALENSRDLRLHVQRVATEFRMRLDKVFDEVAQLADGSGWHMAPHDTALDAKRSGG